MEDAAEAEAGAVGRLVEDREVEDRRLIRLVRARPLLYARNNIPVASYYNQVKALWLEVAHELRWTADVRRKWSHIRNSYSRHLRNESLGARTGRGRARSRWYLADELTFLRDHMATDTRSAPFSGLSPSLLHLSSEESGCGWAGGGPGAEGSEDSAGSSAPHTLTDDNTAYYQFFRGLHPEYTELTHDNRRRFKRRCLQLLHQLLDRQDGVASVSGGADVCDDDGAGGDSSGAEERAAKVRVIDPYCVLPH